MVEVQTIFEWTNEIVAKAASAREQISRATTNSFRHLRATHRLEEESLAHNSYYICSFILIRKMKITSMFVVIFVSWK